MNLPYVLAGYFCDKIAWLWRVSPGQDASAKMMAVMAGMEDLFSNPLPSFYPKDLLIGAGCGVALRLVVYFKAKNAKKFRHGMEYGSARWGNAKDIEPYVDPVFENNVLLTETERLMMSGRPRQPKYARNKNILVIGGSGSGKTRFFVKPNLMQMHSSYVVTDPKLLAMGPKLVAITLGEQGVLMATKSRKEIIKAFQTHAVDTTGAGDSFWGGVLCSILSMNKNVEKMEWEEIKKCAVLGNAVAGLCVQKRGGIPAIPTKEAVFEFMFKKLIRCL